MYKMPRKKNGRGRKRKLSKIILGETKQQRKKRKHNERQRKYANKNKDKIKHKKQKYWLENSIKILHKRKKIKHKKNKQKKVISDKEPAFYFDRDNDRFIRCSATLFWRYDRYM